MDFTPCGSIKANQVHPGELLVISSPNTKANAIKCKEKNKFSEDFLHGEVGWFVK